MQTTSTISRAKPCDKLLFNNLWCYGNQERQEKETFVFFLHIYCPQKIVSQKTYNLLLKYWQVELARGNRWKILQHSPLEGKRDSRRAMRGLNYHNYFNHFLNLLF